MSNRFRGLHAGESLPSYMKKTYSTARRFRETKRRDVRAALRAVGKLVQGCIYTPAYDEIVEAERLLEKADKLLTRTAYRP